MRSRVKQVFADKRHVRTDGNILLLKNSLFILIGFEIMKVLILVGVPRDSYYLVRWLQMSPSFH